MAHWFGCNDWIMYDEIYVNGESLFISIHPSFGLIINAERLAQWYHTIALDDKIYFVWFYNYMSSKKKSYCNYSLQIVELQHSPFNTTHALFEGHLSNQHVRGSGTPCHVANLYPLHPTCIYKVTDALEILFNDQNIYCSELNSVQLSYLPI